MTLSELYEVADDEDVTVDAFDLQGTEALAVMAPDGRCFVAIDPMQLRSEEDEKEKLAHELGHCVRGAFYNAYSPYDIRARHEYKANAWAYRTLVPRDELWRVSHEIDATDESVAEHFGVSVEFLRRARYYYRERCRK